MDIQFAESCSLLKGVVVVDGRVSWGLFDKAASNIPAIIPSALPSLTNPFSSRMYVYPTSLKAKASPGSF
jgi:hypothetical protein